MAALVLSIDPPPTQLNVYLKMTDTSIRVADTSNFTPTGLLSINQQETVTYSGIEGNIFTGVVRGCAHTSPQSFSMGTKVWQVVSID